MSHPAGNVLGFGWWLAIAIKVIGSLKLLGNLWNNSIAEGACQGIMSGSIPLMGQSTGP